MNWYKKSQQNKESNFSKGFIGGSIIGAILYFAAQNGINITEEEAKNIALENGNNPQLIYKELEKKREPIQTPIQTPIQENQENTKKQESTATKADIGFDFEEFLTQKLIPNEGFRNKVYDDGRSNKTIGVGHLVTENSRNIFKGLFGNQVDFNSIVSGRSYLTNDQVKKLAHYDMEEHLIRAKRLFPQFEKYPSYVQHALLDSVYRGDTGPKTIKLINEGKWEEASREYLNRYDYKNADKLKIPGIKNRMETNQKAFLQYSRELNANARI